MRRLVKVPLLFLLFINLSYGAKVISIGGSITETVVALGHKNDLIAIDISSIYPKEELKGLPNVGYWLQLPKEGIISLKPEVVIVSEKSKPKKLIESLPKFGIKTYVIDDKPTLKSVENKITQVAVALGEEKKAKEIISRIDTNVGMIQSELKDIKTKPKVLFLFSRGKSMTMAMGTKTKIGAMIELAGGKNAVDFPQFTKISPESLLKMNPDVVFYSNHTGKEGFDDENIKYTNAGKNGQVYYMDMLLVSGFTVRFDEALKELSCRIHKNKLSYCK